MCTVLFLLSCMVFLPLLFLNIRIKNKTKILTIFVFQATNKCITYKFLI